MGAVSRTEVLLSLVLMVVGVLLASKVAASVLHPRDEVGDRIKPFPFVVLCVLGEHGGSMVLLQLCRDQGSRYRSVRPNRSKSNLNLKSAVRMVRTGIPAGLTGRFDW